MGFDIKRFQGDVDEELICPICSGVLEDPLQVCHVLISLLFINLFVILKCSVLNYRRQHVSTLFVVPVSLNGSVDSPLVQ